MEWLGLEVFAGGRRRTGGGGRLSSRARVRDACVVYARRYDCGGGVELIPGFYWLRVYPDAQAEV